MPSTGGQKLHLNEKTTLCKLLPIPGTRLKRGRISPEKFPAHSRPRCASLRPSSLHEVWMALFPRTVCIHSAMCCRPFLHRPLHQIVELCIRPQLRPLVRQRPVTPPISSHAHFSPLSLCGPGRPAARDRPAKVRCLDQKLPPQ